MPILRSPWRPLQARAIGRGLTSAYPTLGSKGRTFVKQNSGGAIEDGAGNAQLLQKITYVLLWIFAFAIPWENGLLIPGFGTVGRAAGLAAFGLGVLAVLDSGRLRAPVLQHVLMFLVVTWVGLTYFWSFAPARTRIVAVTFLQLLAMVWLIWQFAQTRRQQILLLRAFVLGTIVSAGATLVPLLNGAGAASGPYYGRYTSMGFNPGDMALILALSLPISLYLMVCDETWRFRFYFYGAHVALALCAILLTASRGGLIACCAVLPLVPFVVSRLSRQQKTVGLTLVLLMGVGMLSVVPESSWSRIGTIGSEVRSGTLNERTMIWQTGWMVFGQSPFWGVGAAAFAPSANHALGMPFHEVAADGEVNIELAAHNTFLSVLVEQGVIGFGLYLAMLLTLVLSALRLPAIDRAFWLSVLLTWTIGVSGLTWEDRKPSWFIFGVLVAAAAAQIPSMTQKYRWSAMPGHRPSQGFQGPIPARNPLLGRWS